MHMQKKVCDMKLHFFADDDEYYYSYVHHCLFKVMEKVALLPAS